MNPVKYIYENTYINVYNKEIDEWVKMKVKNVNIIDKQSISCDLFSEETGMDIVDCHICDNDYGYNTKFYNWNFTDENINNIIYDICRLDKKNENRTIGYCFLFSMIVICFNNILILFGLRRVNECT